MVVARETLECGVDGILVAGVDGVAALVGHSLVR